MPISDEHSNVQLGVASTRPIVAEENVAKTVANVVASGIDVAIFQIPLLPGTKNVQVEGCAVAICKRNCGISG